MKFEKFKSEIETLQKFFSLYCKNRHSLQNTLHYKTEYKNKTLEFNIRLCKECGELFLYAVERLKECPHDPKPRCRNCKNPCYEKGKFKQMAKIMRYSGLRLGLTKMAKKLKFRKEVPKK